MYATAKSPHGGEFKELYCVKTVHCSAVDFTVTDFFVEIKEGQFIYYGMNRMEDSKASVLFHVFLSEEEMVDYMFYPDGILEEPKEKFEKLMIQLDRKKDYPSTWAVQDFYNSVLKYKYSYRDSTKPLAINQVFIFPVKMHMRTGKVVKYDTKLSQTISKAREYFKLLGGTATPKNKPTINAVSNIVEQDVNYIRDYYKDIRAEKDEESEKKAMSEMFENTTRVGALEKVTRVARVENTQTCSLS